LKNTELKKIYCIKTKAKTVSIR